MRGERARVLAVLVAVLVAAPLGPLHAAGRCLRQPTGQFGFPPPAKTPGSGGYRVRVVDNHTEYEPGQRYEVMLDCAHQHIRRFFTGFYLSVEPAVPAGFADNLQVGRFRAHGDPLIRFADDSCPGHTIMHNTDAPKPSVLVTWMAPSAGSGCVNFRATVMEASGAWFQDDDQLTYKMCEHVRHNEDEQPPPLTSCCACDEAKYEVTFEGLWSRNTHPTDFPIDRTAAAFSDLIGASHSARFRFWEYGGLASEGVKQVAEWGDTKKLENELKARSGDIRTIIKARGLEYPKLQGQTFAVFRVDRHHHQASLMSRIKPSPDWLVGVSAMELCLRNCSWAERQVLNLRPWDAGTRSGDSYLGGSMSPSLPQQKIQRITSKWPANSPFRDVTGVEIPPLARLVMRRQRVYERHCPPDDERARFTAAGALHSPAHAQYTPHPHSTDCSVTAWSDWSACSATCGHGRRARRRYFHSDMNAAISAARCNQVRLEESSICSASIPCDAYDPRSDLGAGGGGGGAWHSPPYAPWYDNGPTPDVCALEEWSEWGPCSTTCGPGVRRRVRNFKSHMGRKHCSEDTSEEQECAGQNAPCLENEQLPPGCDPLPWSEWSPCSVTCGRSPGMRVRKRVLSPQSPPGRCDEVKLEDRAPCHPPREDCRLPSSVCLEPMDIGKCSGSQQRWYYSAERRSCKPFTYTGCKGNYNRFLTPQECEDTCGQLPSWGSTREFGTSYTGTAGGGESDQYGHAQHAPGGGSRRDSELFSSSQVINPLLARNVRSHQHVHCAVGPWAAWGPCSATCGTGTQQRRRWPLHRGRAGTAGCGKHRLVKHRHCRWLPDC